MKPIVEIRELSKQYRLGASHIRKTQTFRELLQGAATAPFRAWTGKNGGLTKEELYTFWALDGVSLNLNQGDVLGIIGRNGAGKSTLLKILSRITSPTKGEVVLRGRLASLLEVGTGFHPELTGRENIYLNGAILGMRKAEIDRSFDEIVAFAEVEKFLDTPVKHYSSGMYVRLAFAVAAHLNPEILVVDEVLAVGDLSFQKKCLGKMGEVSRGGRTVLFVSHNMAAVENLCTRAVVLKQGRLCFDGGGKEAIQFYLNSLSDRSGSGHIVELQDVGVRRSIVGPLLKRLEFFTDNEEPLAEGLLIGSRLKVKVHFDLPQSTTFNVGLGFHNSYGQRIFTAHSIFDPNRPDGEHVGNQVICCEIPSFTLMPGEYTVNVWLDLKNADYADVIGDAAKITVLEADFYGSGRVPFTGAFVLKHRWYLEPPVREAVSALQERAGS